MWQLSCLFYYRYQSNIIVLCGKSNFVVRKWADPFLFMHSFVNINTFLGSSLVLSLRR